MNQGKPPSASPPVQLQQQQHVRQQQPYQYRATTQQFQQPFRQISQEDQIRTYYPYFNPAATHDMSKSHMAAHVPTGQAAPQGMLYTPPPPTQATHRAAAPYMRPMIPQNLRPSGQPQPRISMATSGAGPGQVSGMAAAQQHPGNVYQLVVGGFLPQQPMIIPQGQAQTGQVPYQRGPQPVQQQPQYTINPNQQGGYTMPQQTQQTYYQQQPNNTVYFPQPTAAPRPMTAQPAPQPVERKRNIIEIIDPKTGKKVNDEIAQMRGGEGASTSGSSSKASTPPVSGSSSLRATPVTAVPEQPSVPAQAVEEDVPPLVNNDIAAQFAAQVAATLKNPALSNDALSSQDKSEEVTDGQAPSTPSGAEEVLTSDDVSADKQEVVDNVAASTEETSETLPKSVDVEPAETTVAAPVAAIATPIEEESKKEATPPPEIATPKTEESTKVNKTVEEDNEEANQRRKKNRANKDVESESKPTTTVITTPAQEKAADVSEKNEVPNDVQEVTPPPQPEAATTVPAVAEETSPSSVAVADDVAMVTNDATPADSTKEVEIDSVSKKVAEKNEKNEATRAATVETTSQEVDVVEEEATAPVVKVEEVEELEEGEIRDEDEENTKPIIDATPVIKKNKTELKYKYREDQWSPLNVEGKKQYDRSFLLQLQYSDESTSKPSGLPNIPDVVLDKVRHNDGNMGGGMGMMGGGGSVGGHMHNMRHPMNTPDFTPGFFKSTPSKDRGSGGGGSMGGRNRSNQKNIPPRKVINISMGAENVKLHQTENKWKAGSKQTEELTEDGEIMKKVRGILNKLTPQKFQTLVTQVMDFDINTEERLKGTIDLTFEKAIDEPGFSVAYANLCKCLMGISVPRTNQPSTTVTFRVLLLNRCQTEFQKDKEEQDDVKRRQQEILEAKDEDKKKLIDENTYQISMAKRRTLGNIRFIGELFKLKMLTEGIMHDCLMTLLRSNDEESLECLCRLLTTIGKELDHTEAKPRIDQYFSQLNKIVNEKRTSARVRFMIQDVLELRKCNWKPRREDNNPKTIDQIHEEAKNESIQRAQMAANTPLLGKGGSGRKGDRGRPGTANEEGWQSVTKMQRQLIDHSKMKITTRSTDSEIKLGPGGHDGYTGWGRGSSGGERLGSQEKERSSTPCNRFHALREPHASESRGRSTPSRDSKGRSGGSLSRGKSRPSMEKERESAISSVMSIVGGQGRRTPTGSRNQSRESSRNRESSRDRPDRRRSSPARPQSVPTPPTVVVKKEMSEAEIEKKTKAIIDEYLHLANLAEATLCVKELNVTGNMHLLVTAALNHVLEGSSKARTNVGGLMQHYIKEHVITSDSYLNGLKGVLEFAEDMEIDIPKIWQYLGEFIAPVLQDGTISMPFLRSACEPLMSGDKAGVLIVAVLDELVKKLGQKAVGQMWISAQMKWTDFVPESQVNYFIAKHKLEYTEDIHYTLLNMLKDDKKSNQDIMNWIEEFIGDELSKQPNFIRPLITAVCENAIIEEQGKYKVQLPLAKECSVLLLKYLDHKSDRELQALYALQGLVHKLDHPAGLLRTFFDFFYDEDLISEDAFKNWDTNDDPAEMPGKGVAKSSVFQFFSWLEEADEEGG